MAQHFLLSAKARTLSVRKVMELTNDEAFQVFKEVRWGSGDEVACPVCGTIGKHYFKRSRKQWQCKDCGHTFSVTSGTIFAFHKLPLRVYLAAIAIYTNAVKGISAFIDAVEDAFGADIDFAQLVKIYGSLGQHKNDARRYSPAEFTGSEKRRITGNPEIKHVSTSYVERQNLTMRMHMRRFTRLTNAFSKKLENHMHAISLYFMFYNFCKIHKSLRVTPAMAAGVSETLWEISDIVKLIPEDAPKKRGSYKKKISN